MVCADSCDKPCAVGVVVVVVLGQDVIATDPLREILEIPADDVQVRRNGEGGDPSFHTSFTRHVAEVASLLVPVCCLHR